ncbi:hypothetical protein LUZ60_004406 [Juncus effusus]|nr:hypothetical protein LUZ60_004406 [Juncus effusus]
MGDKDSVATLIDSTTSKIQRLQQAFSELESHNALLLNLKWKQLEEHFYGLEETLKTRFVELENQEREFSLKLNESQELIANKEATVLAKELASLDRLQEKQNKAFNEILGKRKAFSANLDLNNSQIRITKSKKDDSVSDSKPRTELETLCMEMNVNELHKYISENRKNLTSIREEIPSALKSAPDPYNLVLESLKDFYSGESLLLDGKKDGNLLGVRRTCLMLMESLSLLKSGNPNPGISIPGSERARGIAVEWKGKLEKMDLEGSNGNSLEAHAFLQLVVSFGVVEEFESEELCKLVPAVSRRRQTPELCKALGLSHKMPGVIEVLVSTGRQIDAVNLAYAFGLTDQYSPIPLLKSYLKEVRKSSNSKSANSSPGAQNEINERELSALKAVIKCIEDHKLESQYSTDPLSKRVAQLEKAKADKRRSNEASKPVQQQPKRARANGSVFPTRLAAAPYQETQKSFYQRVVTPERYSPVQPQYQYVYPVEYAVSGINGGYYGNNGYGVQYQPVQYIH